MPSNIQKCIIVMMILYASAVTGSIALHPDPRVPTEARKAWALKLGYLLNHRSMVRWGSIDTTPED